VLLVSQRNISDQVANAALYEFEDLLCALDRVDLIASNRSPGLPGKLYKLARLCGAPRQVARTVALRPEVTAPARDYQLLLAIFDHYRQIASIHLVEQWRRRCERAVCFIGEIWPKDLHDKNSILELFDVFDHIFVGVDDCADLLAKIVGKPCTTLYHAVDALQLSPQARMPRCIDVCSIGRRSDVTHRQLLALAQQDHLFYYFDTLKGPLRCADHREHRLVFANILKRSRYFIANYGKIDRPDHTGGVQAVAGRFFEGAAAGTVMLGQPPATAAFKRLFPWPDAVIEAPFDAPDIADLIRELDADPERTARIRSANVVNALRRHDWLHRYEEMLSTVGLDRTPAMAERREQLETRADRADRSTPDLRQGAM
jgi:hypothetical protein